MKYSTFLLMVIIGINSHAQSGKWWKPSKLDYYSMGAMVVSGVAKGYNQAIIHHHYGRGNQFWDKTVSWQNKYKDYPTDQSAAYFGSKSILVFTTDGQHLTQAIDNTFLVTGTGLSVWDIKQELKEIPKKDRWKYILWRKILLPFGMRTLAFELTFKHL